MMILHQRSPPKVSDVVSNVSRLRIFSCTLCFGEGCTFQEVVKGKPFAVVGFAVRLVVVLGVVFIAVVTSVPLLGAIVCTRARLESINKVYCEFIVSEII